MAVTKSQWSVRWVAFGLLAACGSGAGGPVDVEGPGPEEDEYDVGDVPRLPDGAPPDPTGGTGGSGPTSTSATGGGSGAVCSVPTTGCYDCAQAACGLEFAACVAETDCCCWVACVGNGGDLTTCEAECGSLPALIDPMQTCVNANCTAC